MIEKNFVSQNLKQIRIKNFISKNLSRLGISNVRLERSPLGDKIVVETSRPGIVVGRKGKNISMLTKELKSEFALDNPEIEVLEIENPYLDAYFVADKIASSFERYGTKRFKGIMYSSLDKILGSGALGAEIIISGKIPGARAKTWRSAVGYLKKSGDIAVSEVRSAKINVTLKSGTAGIKVRIMPPGIVLPDTVTVSDDFSKPEIEEIKEPLVKEDNKSDSNGKKE